MFFIIVVLDLDFEKNLLRFINSIKNIIYVYIFWYKYIINVFDLVNVVLWFGMFG